MSTYSPVEIDTTDNGNAAAPLVQIVYNNQLYAVLFSAGHLAVFNSTDGGNSWTELDGANRPAFGSAGAVYDGVDTIVCAVRLGPASPNDLNLINFDLASGTWGAFYGTVLPPSTSALSIAPVYVRPDGTIVVISSPKQGTAGAFAANPTGFQIDVYDPNTDTWAASVDAGANIAALPGWDATRILLNMSQSTACMDSTGRVHIFLNTISFLAVPVIWGNRVFYQAWETNDSLGAFEDFPGQSVVYAGPPNAGRQKFEAFSGPPFGQPTVIEDFDMIFVAASAVNRTQTFPRLNAYAVYGTPIAAPVWFFPGINDGVSIDPDCFIDTDLEVNEAPNSFYDGTNIYCVFPVDDVGVTAEFQRLRLCNNTPQGVLDEDPWTPITAFDLAVDSPPGFDIAGQICVLPSVRVFDTQVMLTMDSKVPPTGVDEARYWLGNFTPVSTFVSPLINPAALPVVSLPNPAKICS